MDLARVHEALLQAHQELIEDPRHGVEGLDAASCPPHIRHLAQLAIRGNVGRLHRRAVAVLDRRRHRTRSRPTSGDGGILHAQLGPFSPWPRLKESTDDRDALPADHPELAARGKELAPSVHEALERCGTVKVTVRGAGFHADSVVQIRETPEAIPEPILLGETTVRNGEFVWSHSFDFGFGERVVEGTQVLRLTVSGQQSHVSRDKEVYVFYKEKTRAPDRSCNPLIPASS